MDIVYFKVFVFQRLPWISLGMERMEHEPSITENIKSIVALLPHIFLLELEFWDTEDKDFENSFVVLTQNVLILVNTHARDKCYNVKYRGLFMYILGTFLSAVM